MISVPVVRCGECDRRIKSADLTNTVLCGWLHKITMNKDDFCSYGAKMEDKHYCEIANERLQQALAELDKEGER